MMVVNVVAKSVRFLRFSAIPATHLFSMSYGAGDRVRTGDVQLGKLGKPLISIT
jgi:hypothetical protein